MGNSQFFKIGHRGCGYEPENTLRSFQKAIDLGANMVEADVWLTNDNKLAVIHDKTVNRTTNGRGQVKNFTLAELKKLDAGKLERIPALEEVLDLINKKAAINIELKGEGTAGPVARLIQKYVQEGNWPYDNFLVSSLNHQELTEFKKLLPQVNVGALIDKLPVDFIGLEKMRLFSVNLAHKIVSQKLIDEAHRHNWQVLVYTVNEPKKIQQLKEIGADGVFSNYPDRL